MRLFAILALSLGLSAGASAEPVKLGHAQMDAISAGRTVRVVAAAAAPGEIAIALTDTNAQLRARRKIGIAIGRSLAVAVGNRSAVAGVDLFGEGGIVRARTPSFRFVTRDALIFSRTAGFVFAIELHDLQVQNVRFIRTKGLRRGAGLLSRIHRFGFHRAS